MHRISASFALGDAGTAIAHAKTVNPADLRLPERRSRYWVDVARAYHQWCKPGACYRALVIAESQAPEEVRARPVVRKLASDLLTSDNQPRLRWVTQPGEERARPARPGLRSWHHLNGPERGTGVMPGVSGALTGTGSGRDVGALSRRACAQGHGTPQQRQNPPTLT